MSYCYILDLNHSFKLIKVEYLLCDTLIGFSYNLQCLQIKRIFYHGFKVLYSWYQSKSFHTALGVKSFLYTMYNMCVNTASTMFP